MNPSSSKRFKTSAQTSRRTRVQESTPTSPQPSEPATTSEAPRNLNDGDTVASKTLVCRSVNFQLFKGYPEVFGKLTELFAVMGWSFLGSFSYIEASPSLVKDFFCSLHLDENGNLRTFVASEARLITPQEWGSFFKLPYDNGVIFAIEGFDAQGTWESVTGTREKSMLHILDPIDRIVLAFNAYTLICRSQGYSTYDPVDAWVLLHARNRTPINVTVLMFSRMLKSVSERLICTLWKSDHSIL